MGKKLYIGNLPFSVDSDKLRDIFSQYGDIEDATVITDKFSRRSKGFGFVTFANDEDADKAVSEMNDKEVEGRALKVNEARPMEDRPPRPQGRSFGGGGGGGRFGGNSRGGGSGGRQRRF